MKWLAYNLLFGCIYMLMLPKFIFRMLRRGGYARHFLQRIGCYNDELKARLADGEWIWMHAVSVGEMGVALRVMQELRHRSPAMRFVVSTNTSTAHALAEKKLPAEDILVYFPLDIPPVAKRVARLIKPKMLLLTECELWPNLIRRLHNEGVPIVLYNGRISDSSYSGYKKAGFFFRDVVGMLDAALMQSEDDMKRMLDLGLDDSKVSVSGTVKYDMSSAGSGAADAARGLLQKMGLGGDGLILLGGSTWPGEEAVLTDIFKKALKRIPGLKLVLVPRHAERRNEVTPVIEAAGLTYLKKSDIDEGQEVSGADVLLVDTTGELKHFYAIADVVFVGKSLKEHGGQNFIEPALFGKPIVVGPNLENFPVVAKEFLGARAMVQVQDAEGLEREIVQLLEDESHRISLGERALSLVKAKGGATHRTADKVLELLG